MSEVQVTFRYRPEADEIDSEDSTGLTEEAHGELMDKLNFELGASDIKIEKIA